MFALRVQYLTGRSVSQEYNDRMSAEWPPHPARLYFALASAFFETGEDPDEEVFLKWLERQETPALVASEARRRTVQVHYVPVNDARVLATRAGRAELLPLEELSVLPEYRRRQPRTFPVALPRDPVAYFIWRRAHLPSELRQTAERLVGKVSYLGHSSSLVSIRVDPHPPEPTHEPDDGAASSGGGRMVLRVPFDGQLEALRRSYRRYLSSGIRGPLPTGRQAYRPAGAVPAGQAERVAQVFGEMVVFRREAGPVLPLPGSFLAVEALRGAALARCPEPIPEVLSGHTVDGRRSERPHVAFVPLPDVGHRHADGHVMGLAAVLPVGLVGEERRAVLRALGLIKHLVMGAAGTWFVERLDAGSMQRAAALRPETWTRPASRWATVTPILLDRYPEGLFGPEAEDIVKESCQRVGLPRPVYVLLSAHSIVTGVPPTHAFRALRGNVRNPRPMVHAVLDFPCPVPGPVLLGAGRYRGWGLCRPLR